MISIANKKNNPKGEYVGRPSVLGNPFKITKESERELVIDKYRQWLQEQIRDHNPQVIAELSRLKAIADTGDLVLICWCSPRKCHAEVIKEILEAM